MEISPGRTVADAEAIGRLSPLVSYVTPISELSGCSISRGNQSFRNEVSGCWPDFIPINKHELEFGRGLSVLDTENAQRVCVIGRMWSICFGPTNPISIRLAN